MCDRHAVDLYAMDSRETIICGAVPLGLLSKIAAGQGSVSKFAAQM